MVIDECEKAGLKLGKYSDLWGSNNWQAKEVIFARRVGSQNGFEYNNYPRGVEKGNGGNSTVVASALPRYLKVASA